jgi:hypothetical protein
MMPTYLTCRSPQLRRIVAAADADPPVASIGSTISPTSMFGSGGSLL